MKKQVSIFTSLLLLTLAPIVAQETITDAFQDLKRQGTVSESDSQMRIVADNQALDKLIKENPTENYFIFTEDRMNDIRMTDALPQQWLTRDVKARRILTGQAQPGEFYIFQIAVYSPYQDLNGLSLSFFDLKNAEGKNIDSKEITCFNLEGIDTKGSLFRKDIPIQIGYVQALWVGVEIPKEAKGKYSGELVVNFANAKSSKVEINIDVEGEPVLNNGDNEGWRKSRLRWLNSTVGISNEPTAPYINLSLTGNSIHYLGGFVELSPTGLPKRIVTHYDQSNNLSTEDRNDILAGELRFVIETDKGEEKLSTGKLNFKKQNSGSISWESLMTSQSFQLLCQGTMLFDGSIEYSLQLKSLQNTTVKDVRLEVPYTDYASKYMMGLGHKGGYRKNESIEWHWDVSKHQDKIWLGNVNAGLNLNFKDENYVRPLVNVYYTMGRINLPKSWGNSEKGGVTIDTSSTEGVLVSAFSGSRDMKEQEVLHYNVDMLITPVKPLNLAEMATNRLYHSNSDLSENYISEAKKAGANFINVHHKKDIYPFINYPYSDESIGDLQKFINEAQKSNIGTRLYYTTRELTVKVPEIWALRSLNNEVIHNGPGKYARTIIHKDGPNKWLVDNLQTNFIPAWYNAFREGKYKDDMDISVITTPDSRWNNYYLAGLDWMVKNIGLGGVYIDDSALDPGTLRRARNILDYDGKSRLIDLHSWNHMNPMAGYANSIHIYMNLLPYVDRTWIGEGFSADNSIDFWMVEMSGIPYGMVSESLDAKNRFRGLVYGMLPRLPWSGNPVPLWKVWDNFGMKTATMRGYWDKECPVKTSNNNIYTSVFINKNKALLAVANWTKEEQNGNFSIDEKLLGFKPKRASLPHIEGLQEAKKIDISESFNLQAEGGMIILLEK